MVSFYFMVTFLSSTSTSRNNSLPLHATLFIKDVATLYLHRLQVVHGTADTTWNHVMKEKGPTFIPGQDIPEEVRITAWEFMGQQVPQNYGRLVFGTPLCNENDFDPCYGINLWCCSRKLSRKRGICAG